DGIRDKLVTGVQTCALPISRCGFGLFLLGGHQIEEECRHPGFPQHARYELVARTMAATPAAMGKKHQSRSIVRKTQLTPQMHIRSEERRVGKECRTRRWQAQ